MKVIHHKDGDPHNHAVENVEVREMPTEAEAREALGDAISHFAAFHTQVNRDMCADCIDAYAEAVRAAERERLDALAMGLPWRVEYGPDDETHAVIFRAALRALFERAP